MEQVIDDPSQVKQLFEALMQGANLKVLEDEQYEAVGLSSAKSPEAWFHKAYRGGLSESQLAFLGI